MITSNALTIVQRVTAPTPPFFKKLRAIGLVIAAVGSGLLTAKAATPDILPALLAKISGYLALAGSVLSAVSQTAVENNFLLQKEEANE